MGGETRRNERERAQETKKSKDDWERAADSQRVNILEHYGLVASKLEVVQEGGHLSQGCEIKRRHSNYLSWGVAGRRGGRCRRRQRVDSGAQKLARKSGRFRKVCLGAMTPNPSTNFSTRFFHSLVNASFFSVTSMVTLGLSIPTEMLQGIFVYLLPRDLVGFSQLSCRLHLFLAATSDAPPGKI